MLLSVVRVSRRSIHMSTTRRASVAACATLLLSTLLPGISGSPGAETSAIAGGFGQQPPAAPAVGQPPADPSAPAGRGGRGGRGDGGLPPMNPIDENAPPPPLATPGKLPGEPPSDAVVLFDGTDV